MLTLNWMLKNQKAWPIGLDIGRSCIKMVQLAPAGDTIRVQAVERGPLAPPGSMDAQEQRRCIILTIKKMLARGSFNGCRVVSALSNDELRITSLRVAETEALQADRLLRKEAAQRFNIVPETDTIHYMLAGSVRQDDEVKDEFIVLAADAETITRHIALLEEAGLQPAGIDAAPCALLRSFEKAMRREEDRQRTIIFMDVGCCSTTAIFALNGEICLVKQMPFGTMRFNEDIAAKLDITPAEAESLRLRRQRGEFANDSTDLAITDALTATAEQMAKELSLCLRYHTVTFRGRRVERAIVAGGGASEEILLEVLRRHLSIKVEVAEPLRGLDAGRGVAAQERTAVSADLALAVGLSLKGHGVPGAAVEKPQDRPEPVLEGEDV